MDVIPKIGLGLVVVLLFGVVSNNDFDDALQSEQQYRLRVCDGAHSDYLEIGVQCDER